MKLIIGLIVAIYFALIKCDSLCPSASPQDANQSSIALTEFAIDLFRNVSASLPDKNAVMSPVSVALALAILENGANGATKTRIQNLLAAGANAHVLSLYSILQKQLHIDDGKTKLTIANGLFSQKALSLKHDYVSLTKNCFDTEVQAKDFASQLEQTRQEINKWISDKTNQKIPELFKQGALTQDVVLVLANAIYFKASWDTSFSIDPHNKPFYKFGREQDVQNITFMTKTDVFGHAALDGFYVLRLGYQHEDLAMYLFVPQVRDGLNSLEANLTAENFKFAISKVETSRLRVKLPRFTVRSAVDLKHTLSAMGLDIIFSDSADFGQMSTTPLKVSKASHEAFIKVNENGTEAAAVTGLGLSPRSGPSATYAVDHPFIYSIVHQPTGAVVFIGKLNYVDDKEN